MTGKAEKTNVMRILDKAEIPYQTHFYSPDTGIDAVSVANALGQDPQAVEMIPQKALLPNTGYIHGGCSPIGMKKLYPTFIDESAQLFDAICVSAGKIGAQVELAPDALCGLVSAKYAELTD